MSSARTMETELRQLRNGEITGDEFVRRTKKDFANLTRVTYRRWDLPAAMEPEDVQQELLLRTFEPKPQSGKTLLEKWDPARCAKLSRYVVFNAMADLSKSLQRQREKGHYALAYSTLGEEEEDRTDHGEVASQSETALDAKLLLKKAQGRMKPSERLALRVLVRSEGDVEEAAQAIDRSVPWSIACDVGSVDEARVLLRLVVALVRECAFA